MADALIALDAFETEVAKVLKALSRKKRHESRAKGGSEGSHTENAERKLKEVFEYYKTKIPSETIATKLLELGRKFESAELYELSNRECYLPILDQSQDQQHTFHTRATAFYRKAICDCKILLKQSRGFQTGASNRKLLEILDRVQKFMYENIKDEYSSFAVFNGTVILHEISHIALSYRLGQLALPYLIFCLGCLDCIEMLYIPHHIGWYVQLCISIAECCDVASAPDETSRKKNIDLAQTFLKQAKAQVETMQKLASMDHVSQPGGIVALMESSLFKLSLYYLKFEMEDIKEVEQLFPKVGDRMIALLLTLQKPNKNLIVDHYCPEEGSREHILLTELSKALQSYTEIANGDDFKLGDIFTTYELDLESHSKLAVDEILQGNYEQRTLFDCMHTLCRTFYFYEQWLDFDCVCKHIFGITKDNSQDEGMVDKMSLDESLSGNLVAVAMVLNCCRKVVEEKGSYASIKDLASVMGKHNKNKNIDFALDANILLCKHSQSIIRTAITCIDELSIKVFENHSAKRKASKGKHHRTQLKDATLKEGDKEVISIAKSALLCIDNALRDHRFDDVVVRLRTAIQLGIIVERTLMLNSHGIKVSTNSSEKAQLALSTAIEAADQFRSESILASFESHNQSLGSLQSLVSCLQVDALSLNFRIKLMTAKEADKVQNDQPVSSMRLTEASIISLCNNNAFWLAIFYMQYACVHGDKSKVSSLILESMRQLQQFDLSKTKHNQQNASKLIAIKRDGCVLPLPKVLLVSSKSAIIVLDIVKQSKMPQDLRKVEYYTVDARAASGTSDMRRGQSDKEKKLVPIGSPYVVEKLEANQSYIFLATGYDSAGNKIGVSDPSDQHCACNSLPLELLWCYEAITCARLANELSTPIFKKLPSPVSTLTSSKGSSSLYKLLKVACKYVRGFFKEDLRSSDVDTILNPVDTVQLKSDVVPKTPQAILRSLALVMFCESDILHNHNLLNGSTDTTSESKILMDTQVRTMMQTKHVLMAFELGCLINDPEICIESLSRSNNILNRLILCRTKTPFLVKLVSSVLVLLIGHLSNKNNNLRTQEGILHITSLLMCEMERIYSQAGERDAGSKLVMSCMEVIKAQYAIIEEESCTISGKRAFSVFQLKGNPAHVDQQIESEEIPLPIISLAKQVLHENKGPDAIPDLINSAVKGSTEVGGDSEQVYILIYALGIALEYKRAIKSSLTLKISQNVSQITASLETKASEILLPLYSEISYKEQGMQSKDNGESPKSDKSEDPKQESETPLGDKENKVTSLICKLLKRRYELKKARERFVKQLEAWSRSLLLVSSAVGHTLDFSNEAEINKAKEKHTSPKLIDILNLICMSAEIAAKLGLSNLLRAACVDAWNFCCKNQLLGTSAAVEEGYKDVYLVICSRLIDEIFDEKMGVEDLDFSPLIKNNLYFQHQSNVAMSFDAPNKKQDLEWLAKLQNATFIALTNSKPAPRYKDILRFGADYLKNDQDNQISAQSLKSTLQHLVSITSSQDSLMIDTPDYADILHHMENTSSVCFNSIESCRSLLSQLSHESKEVSMLNVKKAIKAYSSCIQLLQQMDESDLTMEAKQELADVSIFSGYVEKNAKRTLNDLIDGIFGGFQTLSTWRSKFFAQADNNQTFSKASGEWLIRKIGEKKGIVVIAALGKLISLYQNDDLFIKGECAILGSLVSRAILAASFRHPAYLYDFACYSAPHKLCESIDIVHLPRFASIVDLILGLECIATTLLNRKAYVEALPVIVFADHCIIRYSGYKTASDKTKEEEDSNQGSQDHAIPVIWREGMLMHFRTLRIRACIELGYFSSSHAMLLPILKASSSLETLDMLVEEWLCSDISHLIDMKVVPSDINYDAAKAVAYQDNSKALQELVETRIGDAFQERFGLEGKMELASCKSLFLINIASSINLPVGVNGAPDKSYALDESCSVPNLMQAAEEVITIALKGEENNMDKRIFDRDGQLIVRCELLLQIARLKRHICEPRVAIKHIQEAASILQSIMLDNTDADLDNDDTEIKAEAKASDWFEKRNHMVQELSLECKLTLMQCYRDMGNIDQSLSMCKGLSAEAFEMKAYNVLVQMEHIRASLNFMKGDHEITMESYARALSLIENNMGCITPEEHAVLVCDHAVAIEAFSGDLLGAREQWNWASKVFESQSSAQGFSIGLKHTDLINLFCRSTPLYINAMMNNGRVTVTLAMMSEKNSRKYAEEALEILKTCIHNACYCSLDAHIQASMNTYAGCASMILGKSQESLSFFETAFTWFTTGHFSDPGLLRLLLIHAAEALLDQANNTSHYHALIQYASKVSQVVAASKAPEHFEVHFHDINNIPKAINMYLDRYTFENASETNINKTISEDSRAAAMYSSQIVNVAMLAVPSMLAMSFTLMKRWNVLGSIAASNNLNMSAGLFDLGNETEVEQVKGLIAGREFQEDNDSATPGTISFQYFGLYVPPFESENLNIKQKDSWKVRVFYSILVPPEGEGEEATEKQNWCCGYRNLNWNQMQNFKRNLYLTFQQVRQQEGECDFQASMQSILDQLADVFLNATQESNKEQYESQLERPQYCLENPTDVEEASSLLQAIDALVNISTGLTTINPLLSSWLNRVLQ